MREHCCLYKTCRMRGARDEGDDGHQQQRQVCTESIATVRSLQ